MSVEISLDDIFGEIKNPFRWYDSIYKMNRYRKHCQEECDYKLITPFDRLLPFQLPRDSSFDAITSWVIKDSDGNTVLEPDIALLTIKKFTNKDYIIYNSEALSYPLECGYYTSEISDGTNTWYSEVFWVEGGSEGDNVVNDPDFLTTDCPLSATPGTDWYGTDTWNCADQQLCATGTGTLNQNVLSTETFYRIEVGISARLAGSLNLSLGAGDDFDMASNGIHNFYGYSGLSTLLTLTADASFDGCIDYVNIYPITSSIDDCHIKLTWKNSCSLGDIYYNEDEFENYFYLPRDAEVSDPSPKLVREVSEDRGREPKITFQKRTTEYILNVGLVPWFVLDALFEMQLHDTISITLDQRIGGEDIVIATVDYEWSELGGGCLAETNIKFQLEEQTITGGCCDDDFNEITCYNRVDIDFTGIGEGELFFDFYEDSTTSYEIDPPIDVIHAAALQLFLDGLFPGVFEVYYTGTILTVRQLWNTEPQLLSLIDSADVSYFFEVVCD